MWTHTQPLEFGAFFLLVSLASFAGSANRKLPWYVRYLAFVIGAAFLIVGILIPIRIWNV